MNHWGSRCVSFCFAHMVFLLATLWFLGVQAVPSCQNTICNPLASSPCCSPLLSCKRHTQSMFCSNSSETEEYRCVYVPLERQRFPVYSEPVVLLADPVTGVLEVKLIAKASDFYLNSVGRARHAFLFDWELVQGTSSNGFRYGYQMYPAPTLQVFPTQTLVIDFENQMMNDFPDFYDPMVSKANASVPLYPPQLSRPPFNMHTHGLHVSPKGNGDNVLLNIAVGEGNRYKYYIPDNHPQGMYWYHSHLHKLTSPETYRGLAGLLSIGRSDGNLPKVTASSTPIRNMALQYNFIYGRAKGGSILNDPNRPQYVSTLVPPASNESVSSGVYEPKLFPYNFGEVSEDDFVTVWYSGPLSENNNRGQFQFMPGNLQNYTSYGNASLNRPSNPGLDSFDRDVQFTVNGQFQPRLATCPGGTEIWVLANICDMVYLRVKIRETATGLFQQLRLVAQDGNPMPNVQPGLIENGTCIVLPPATRFAIAVSIPLSGSLVLELPPVVAQLQDNTEPGVRYFNKKPGFPAADLGTITVSNDFVSYFDGFFLTPTQVLLETVRIDGVMACPISEFPIGSPTNAFSSFVNTAVMPVNFTRTWFVGGGFPPTSQYNDNDPQGFLYWLNNMVFPFTPLAQPRLDTVEEWMWLNQNNDQHPIHIHVNDFQVIETNDPTYPLQTGVRMWGQDNANLPYPEYDNQGNVLVNGSLTLRTFFQNYTGMYVYHCHRLNHEDAGLMAVINVIPTISIWVASSGNKTTIFNQANDSLPMAEIVVVGTVIGAAVEDFDGDQILDVVIAYSSTRLVIYSGASTFRNIIGTFAVSNTIVSVAAANIDGNSFGANVIVADSTGVISILSSTLPSPTVLTTFVPFAIGTRVSLSTGMLDLHAGRFSIVCASTGVIRIFTFHSTALPLHSPKQIAQFCPFGPTFTGSLATCAGFGSAAIGGGMVLFVAGNDQVVVFSSGSALSGLFPDLYGQSANSPDLISYRRIGSVPSPGANSISFSATVVGGNIFVSGSKVISRYTFIPNYHSKMLEMALVRTYSGTSSLAGQ